MNVLVLAYCIDKEDVSEAHMAYNWIVRLSQHAKLWVITAGSRLHRECGLEEVKNVHLVTLRPRMDFRWVGGFDRAVHPGYVEFYLRAKRVIPGILKSERVDFCHHLTPQATRYPSPLHSLDVPYLIGPVHGGLNTPDVMKELQGKESLFLSLRRLDHFRAKWDYALRGTFKNARMALITAPYVKNVEPVFLCPEHCLVPGVAVDLPACHDFAKNDDSTLRIIFVGRLVPSKGLELLIEAIAKCNCRHIRLDVFGAGPCEVLYREQAERFRISEKIQWHGFVGHQNILEAYPSYDVFAFPSLKEAAGIAPLEAMAFGLPVICVDAGGPSYFVSDETGIRIPLSSKSRMVAELALAIDRLADDLSLRQLMGLRARQRIQSQFTWDAVVTKAVEIYRSIAV